MNNTINVQSITKTFKNFKAINDLTLEVAKGEIYGLLGSNGAGKTTTINILLGFLEPDSGSAYINGVDTSSDPGETRKHTGYIPENVNLYPYLSGLENLDYFCKLTGKDYTNARLAEFLNESGLDGASHNKPTGEYSKGMRQKVGIAIAIAKEANVYLLDEPASGLDPLASNELSNLLKKLSNDGASVLMASHDIFRIRETCHRIGIIKNGVLVKEMESEKVTTKELEKVYIDYMQN